MQVNETKSDKDPSIALLDELFLPWLKIKFAEEFGDYIKKTMKNFNNPEST